MTISTYGPNKLWTSGSTHGYRRDDIMIRDYHLQRHHFQDTNWRIQSIEEIWIIRVFIFKAGTHSTALSQYISIPAKWMLISGIHYQSLWRYGMDSDFPIDLLDVTISMYDVVQNCRSLGPKPSNGRLVTVLVLPSTKQYTSLTASCMDCPRASWYVDTFVQQKHLCGVRNATEIDSVRSPSPQASSFWTVVGHTSPGDIISGTAWRLPARRRLWWHSPNGLGFAPVCWELRNRDLWMRHREPAEVITLACWLSKQGAAAVVAAEGGPHGNPEWLLPARRDMKRVTGLHGLASLWANREWQGLLDFPSIASILSLDSFG